LLKSCTTVDRVEKLFEEGEAYSRRVVRATEAAALGKVQAEATMRRLEAMRVLLATAPAVDRRASILKIVREWSCFVRRRIVFQLLQSNEVIFEGPKQGFIVYFMRKAGDKTSGRKWRNLMSQDRQ
jgi:hypothetical protein